MISFFVTTPFCAWTEIAFAVRLVIEPRTLWSLPAAAGNASNESAAMPAATRVRGRFMLRIVGRRELSTLGPSDLVLLVVMGDLVQNGVTQSDQSITGVFLAISTFGLLTLGMSVVTFKSRRAQTLIQGMPLILVQDGKPLDRNLRSERLRIDDVAEEARAQGIESARVVPQLRRAVQGGGVRALLKFHDGLYDDLIVHLLPPGNEQEQAAFVFARATWSRRSVTS